METIALSADEDLRLPALYFDKVFLVAGKNDNVPSVIRANLRTLLSKEETERLNKITTNYLMSMIVNNKSTAVASILESINKYSNSLVSIYHKSCIEQSIPAVPYFTDGGIFDEYNTGYSSNAVELNITDVPIIDIENVTWEHILDVRSDPDFKRKLRAFRLLFSDNYKNKDVNYVLDSLANKIYMYEEACKHHGLKTKIGAARQLFNSKSLLGVLAISTAGILTNSAATVALSAIAGSIIEAGKVGILILENKSSLEMENANLDIAYLLSIREKGLTKTGV